MIITVTGARDVLTAADLPLLRDGVIVVTRVGRVDGDQRDGAEIRSTFEIRRASGLRLGQSLRRKSHWNTVDVGRDQ